MPILPVLHTQRLLMKILDGEAAGLVLDYYLRNRAFHQPWFAERPDFVFTLKQQKASLEQEHADYLAGRAIPFWLFLKSDPGRIIGRLAFTSIVRGCFHSCFMAYHLDAACQGQGLAAEAAQAAIPVLFRDFGLHRIEANIMPANRRSVAFAERLGFELEGWACRYLKINGQWEDHLHYVLLADGPQRQEPAADHPVLETGTLCLRPLLPADLPAACEYYSRNRDYLEAWNPPPEGDLGSLAGWQHLAAAARRGQAAKTRLLLGLFLKDHPERVSGLIDFQDIRPLPCSCCELGFSIDQLLAGHGLMLEALKESIGYVCARFCLRRINARCLSGNTRSLRLLELLGFQREGLSRQALYLAGQWHDVVLLALLPDSY
jgi:ribosomal-protein-alanine N-acetyltransferase